MRVLLLIVAFIFIPLLRAEATFEIRAYAHHISPVRKLMIIVFGDFTVPKKLKVFKSNIVNEPNDFFTEMSLITASIEENDQIVLKFFDPRVPWSQIGDLYFRISSTGRGSLAGQGIYSYHRGPSSLTLRQFPIDVSSFDSFVVRVRKRNEMKPLSTFIEWWKSENFDRANQAHPDPIEALFHPPINTRIARLKSFIRRAEPSDLKFIATQIANQDDPVPFKSILAELARKGDASVLEFLATDLLAKPEARALDSVGARLIARRFVGPNEQLGSALYYQSHWPEMKQTLHALAQYGSPVDLWILTAGLQRHTHVDYDLLKKMIQNPNWNTSYNLVDLLSNWDIWKTVEGRAISEQSKITDAAERKKQIEKAMTILKRKLSSGTCRAFEA